VFTISNQEPYSPQSASLSNRAVRARTRFEDDHYCLVALGTEKDNYVLLYDADQESWFLGRDEQGVDVSAFWRKHLEDDTYCVPCELMLWFDDQWILVAGEMPLELGIETGIACALIERLACGTPAIRRLVQG